MVPFGWKIFRNSLREFLTAQFESHFKSVLFMAYPHPNLMIRHPIEGSHCPLTDPSVGLKLCLARTRKPFWPLTRTLMKIHAFFNNQHGHSFPLSPEHQKSFSLMMAVV